MTDEITKIWSNAAGQSVFRRKHTKSDGRHVLLYGNSVPDQALVAKGLEAAPTASELRWHPLRQEWSVYSAGRQSRTFKPGRADDPLAPTRQGGPETEIPFSTFEVAVFENRFPCLVRDADWKGAATTATQTRPATGNCEVVVYTDAPEGCLADLPLSRRELLVRTWIDRYRELFEAGCATVIPFENRGDEVGVTLHHPHGQIYGFDFIPPVQAAAVDAFNKGFDLAAGLRDWKEDYEICGAGGLAAFAPPFARYPYEVWIAPLERRRGPWEFSDEEVSGLADLLGEVTCRLDKFFNRPCPYMLSLQAAPKSAGASFHFTVQIYPILRAPNRLKYFATIEHATNVFTVDVLPEQTVIELRNL